MVSLDSPRWKSLSHAYGNATDTPEVLRALYDNDEQDGAWHDIWSALCHQGSVYTATYAAVPHVVEVASRTAPGEQARIDCLVFIGSVAISSDAAPIPDDLKADYEAALVRAEPLALAALERKPADEAHVVYLLQTLAALHGCTKTAELLEGFINQEFIPRCPAELCDVEMYVSIEGGHMFVTLEDPATDDIDERVDVVPPPRSSLAEPAAWTDEAVLPKLIELAQRAGHPDLAAKLVLWDGTIACPKCAAPFPLRATLLDPTDL